MVKVVSTREGVSPNRKLVGVLAFGCLLGYLVALVTFDRGTTVPVLLSPAVSSLATTSSSSSLTSFALPPRKSGGDGWNDVHVYYGETSKSEHFEIITPMSQAQQDVYVAAMLHKTSGFFVDLAAHDATYLSNTYTLERDHGWNGLCLEPNPAYWRRLAYRKCTVVAAVVGQRDNEEIRFHVGNDGAMGGIVKEGFDNTAANVVDPTKVSAYYTVTLTHVLDRFQAPKVIDYLCLDIEGAEFYALKEFAFDRYSFKILTVERPKDDLRALLTKHGYQMLCTISTFGETLWVSTTLKSTLDLSTLPADCQNKS